VNGFGAANLVRSFVTFCCAGGFAAGGRMEDDPGVGFLFVISMAAICRVTDPTEAMIFAGKVW